MTDALIVAGVEGQRARFSNCLYLPDPLLPVTVTMFLYSPVSVLYRGVVTYKARGGTLCRPPPVRESPIVIFRGVPPSHPSPIKRTFISSSRIPWVDSLLRKRFLLAAAAPPPPLVRKKNAGDLTDPYRDTVERPFSLARALVR